MALRLEIETGGAAVLDVLDRMISSMGDLATQQDALTKSVLALVNGSDAVTRSVDRQAQAASKAVNPWERLKKAQEAYQEALTSGDANSQKMAELQLARAETAAKRAEGTLKRRANPAAYAMQDMIMTSRFNLGPFMPLVGKAKAAGLLGDGQIADMITKIMGGAGAASGPVAGASTKAASAAAKTFDFDMSGIGSGAGAAAGGGAGGAAGGAAMKVLGMASVAMAVVGVAVVAVKLFADAVKLAKDKISGYASASFAAGGGPGIGRLAGAGGFFGKSPGEMASMARQWGDSAWGDVLAMSEFAKAGVDPVPAKLGGSTDYSGKFMQMLEHLATMPDEQEAFRAAMRSGFDLEMLGMLRHASDPVRNRVLNDATQFDPRAQQEAADAWLLTNKAMSETQILLAKIGAVGLPIMNTWLKGMLMLIDIVEGAWNYAIAIIKSLPGVGALIPSMGDVKGPKDVELQTNTKALGKLTGAVTDLTGAIGFGADAARKALPRGATAYQNIEAYYRGQAVALGAIVI